MDAVRMLVGKLFHTTGPATTTDKKNVQKTHETLKLKQHCTASWLVEEYSSEYSDSAFKVEDTIVSRL